eukprot:12272178-Alexandrium_andersonii.AAC.1
MHERTQRHRGPVPGLRPDRRTTPLCLRARAGHSLPSRPGRLVGLLVGSAVDAGPFQSPTARRSTLGCWRQGTSGPH